MLGPEIEGEIAQRGFGHNGLASAAGSTLAADAGSSSIGLTKPSSLPVEGSKVTVIPRSCSGGPLNSATMMLPSGHSGRSCRVSSNYPNSKLGEFEIVREVHDIQGGNGADASFRFLTINRHNVM